MAYRVVWMKGQEEVGSAPFGTMGGATSHAKEQFAIQRTQSGVDRVEVRDENGFLCFQFPRTLHA
jgi:hypothetical protein